MTRGMKGCYVYCTDQQLAAFLRSKLRSGTDQGALEDPDAGSSRPSGREKPNVIPLRRVSDSERSSGLPAVPVIDLRFAAGAFSNFQALSEEASEWVELPDWLHRQPGLFVAQVVGESMNRRIPNGCTNPQGTRVGKVVVVQHRRIEDPETGGTYTVKLYSSEKVETEDDGWRHQRITLSPDSDRPGFLPIVIDLDDGDEGFRVVAELLTVLPGG